MHVLSVISQKYFCGLPSLDYFSSQCAKEVQAIWQMFLSVDATQIEINPLIETPQGQVVAVDAKIQFDDNAEFRWDDR